MILFWARRQTSRRCAKVVHAVTCSAVSFWQNYSGNTQGQKVCRCTRSRGKAAQSKKLKAKKPKAKEAKKAKNGKIGKNGKKRKK
ncbi:hypothetical protein CHX27_07355 [Flavobacterium aurantiibacter]|uniref:Uncharacterized protein n=1 Tax=Flavobacterium aurantiibacter TaxID=2023067 RepID=A0A255ZTQ0_9FLAO|nr:hypothetical protein CHX27_07355 [Flavobacterium aurantiibacter]